MTEGGRGGKRRRRERREGDEEERGGEIDGEGGGVSRGGSIIYFLGVRGRRWGLSLEFMDSSIPRPGRHTLCNMWSD